MASGITPDANPTTAGQGGEAPKVTATEVPAGSTAQPTGTEGAAAPADSAAATTTTVAPKEGEAGFDQGKSAIDTGGKLPEKKDGEEKPADEGKDKTAEAKAAEEAAKAPFDATKIKLPEELEKAGVKLDEAATAKIAEIAKKYDIKQGPMQELIDMHTGELMKAAKEINEAPVKSWQDTQKTWIKELNDDKDIGGEKLLGAMNTIAKVFDNPAYGVKGVREALAFTGAGNNPAVVKTIYQMAKALTEGSHVGGTPNKSQPEIGAQAMYPHLKPKE